MPITTPEQREALINLNWRLVDDSTFQECWDCGSSTIVLSKFELPSVITGDYPHSLEHLVQTAAILDTGKGDTLAD